jgi:hypothetical protein
MIFLNVVPTASPQPMVIISGFCTTLESFKYSGSDSSYSKEDFKRLFP